MCYLWLPRKHQSIVQKPEDIVHSVLSVVYRDTMLLTLEDMVGLVYYGLLEHST